MRKRLLEGCRFLVTGLWATLLDVAILTALNAYSSLDTQLCFVLAFGTSAVCRFFADRYFTFRLREHAYFRHMAGELCRYLACCLLTLVMGTIVFELSQRCWGFSAFTAKLLSIPPVTISGYVLFRCIAFNLRKNSA